MVPTTSVPLDGDDARKVLRLIDALEDDVQAVYGGFDIPGSVLQTVEA